MAEIPSSIKKGPLEQNDEPKEKVNKASWTTIRKRRNTIRKLIFMAIVGYSVAGQYIHFGLKENGFQQVIKDNKRLSQEPIPEAISIARADATMQIFGFKKNGVNFDPFNELEKKCVEDDCYYVRIFAEELVDPNEYTINPDRRSVKIDGNDYYCGEIRNERGDVFVLLSRVTTLQDFYNYGEKYVSKFYLIGSAKQDDSSSLTELRIKSRKNARKNMHHAYLHKCGPKKQITVNGSGQTEKIIPAPINCRIEPYPENK